MNNMSTSTNFHNTTFTVDEIDIDTKRPRVDQSSDFYVKQIKLKETRFTQNTNSTPITTKNATKNTTPMRIKQRVLTPYKQDSSRFEHGQFRTNLNLSTIVSSGECRMIPDIVVTEFMDEECCSDLMVGEDKENMKEIVMKKDVRLNKRNAVRIKPASNHSCSDKCQCCNKSVMKIGEDRLFVSNSVHANLAVDEFSAQQKTLEKKNFDADSLPYLDHQPADNPDSYDNDYYLMNELISKPDTQKNPKPEVVPVPKPVDYFYFYCSAEKYSEICRKRLIKLEPMLIDGQLKNALTLLTISPESNDLCLLNEMFERNSPIDLKRIESYVMIRRDMLERHSEHLVRVNENKWLFKRSIILQGDMPKNWMKVKSK